MIKLHRINGDEFILNPDHIELIEERPDTVITLISDRKYIVKEKCEDVLNLIIEYNKCININVKKMVINEIVEDDD
jgi:flagellar protein FlbD